MVAALAERCCSRAQPQLSGLKSTVVTAVAVTPGGGSVFLAAAEAMTAGWGGIAALSRITGIARTTIRRGLAELRGTAPPEAAPRPGSPEGCRAAGAGGQ